jgi:hypothetical protein
VVRAVYLDLPGRGRALHAIWSASDADVLAYLDVDLSTEIHYYVGAALTASAAALAPRRSRPGWQRTSPRRP